MPGRERAVDRGARRGVEAVWMVGRELRQGRIERGLAQSAVARAAGVSQAKVSLIERGRIARLALVDAARLLGVVGLDLSVRTYPGGPALRDSAHLALLERLRARLPREVIMRTEVGLPLAGDPRAWDALIDLQPPIAIDAETRVVDWQAVERRALLNKRDGGVTRLVLLLADTRWNRHVASAERARIEASFPVPGRIALAAITAGRDPGGDAVILI